MPVWRDHEFWRRPGRVPAWQFRSAGTLGGVLLSCALLVACGAPAVPAKVWVKSVCAALGPWQSAVAVLTQQAQREIDQAKTPEQTKQSLTTLLAGAEAASERARKAVSQAGVPDVKDGAKVVDSYLTALARARDAYGHGKSAISKLDASRAEPFYDAVEREFEQLKAEHAASALDVDKIGPASLTRAFDEVSECH